MLNCGIAKLEIDKQGRISLEVIVQATTEPISVNLALGDTVTFDCDLTKAISPKQRKQIQAAFEGEWMSETLKISP